MAVSQIFFCAPKIEAGEMIASLFGSKEFVIIYLSSITKYGYIIRHRGRDSCQQNPYTKKRLLIRLNQQAGWDNI